MLPCRSSGTTELAAMKRLKQSVYPVLAEQLSAGATVAADTPVTDQDRLAADTAFAAIDPGSGGAAAAARAGEHTAGATRTAVAAARAEQPSGVSAGPTVTPLPPTLAPPLPPAPASPESKPLAPPVPPTPPFPAVLAALIVEPILAKSEAAAVSSSGTAITCGM
jgi:hypothetical protein